VADIHLSPDHKFLYVSNRGHNSLAIFRVNEVTGKLTLIGHQTSLGKTPRNFCMDPSGEFLLVANQDSDDVFFFRRNKESGLLQASGEKLSLPSPVCLKIVKF
jgi:6-phosphogluconolactonase